MNKNIYCDHAVYRLARRVTLALRGVAKGNTYEEVDSLLKILPEIVAKLRAMSSLYNV